MTLDEYKIARDRSGISLVENWCRAIGISEDTHKSINSGRLTVSDAVANRISSFFSAVEKRATELRNQLSKELSIAFKVCDVQLNPNTFDILINLPEKSEIMVKHCGVDSMNGWGVYNISFGRGREPLLLLHARAPKWQKKPDLFNWYMWRGPFTGIQSYWNDVNAKMLAECFKE